MYAQSLPRNPLKGKCLLIPKRNHEIAVEVKGAQHAILYSDKPFPVQGVFPALLSSPWSHKLFSQLKDKQCRLYLFMSKCHRKSGNMTETLTLISLLVRVISSSQNSQRIKYLVRRLLQPVQPLPLPKNVTRSSPRGTVLIRPMPYA